MSATVKKLPVIARLRQCAEMIAAAVKQGNLKKEAITCEAGALPILLQRNRAIPDVLLLNCL